VPTPRKTFIQVVGSRTDGSAPTKSEGGYFAQFRNPISENSALFW
jgi:hypothetical protein